MQTNKNLIKIIVITLVLIAAGSGTAPAFNQAQSAAAAPVNVSKALPDTVIAASPAVGLDAFQNMFEQIYQKVNPSVVNIQVVEQATGFSFRGSFGFNNQQNQPAQQALGSGFVWDTAGHIVTNNHVVSGASSIEVTFSDGTTVSGKLVGADPNSDLAVIQVNVPASMLVPVQLADSTKAVVGQLVIAIGNPYGLQGTMTQGIISGLERSLSVGLDNQSSQQTPTYSIPDIIQTDASINPGNSGGVLVDDQGNLIGVTAAIESQSGSNSGIGFVIPSSIVAKVVPSLIKTGTYNHPSLGVDTATLTPAMAKAMNLSLTQQGVLIIDVSPNGPADKAGLVGGNRAILIDGQQTPIGGDVIIAVNGQAMKTVDEMGAYLFDQTKVGQTVTLTILHNGRQKEVKATLAVQPVQ